MTKPNRAVAPPLEDPGSAAGAADASPVVSGPVQRNARDRPFALRLQKACDQNSHVPAYNHGRQAWVRQQLDQRFDTSVSNETVSKWFTGVARPRPDKIRLLAKLLDVDEAWLALGVEPELDPRERKIRNAMADGAVNVVAGFIQMTGGHPAFPEEGDPRARAGARIDLYAIIKGAHYSLHVASAQEDGEAYRFAIPYGHEECVVIGVVQREPLQCDFLELAPDLVNTHGLRRSGHIEVTVQARGGDFVTEGDVWRRITTFGERL